MQCPFKKAGNEFTEIMVPVKITIPANELGGYCFIFLMVYKIHSYSYSIVNGTQKASGGTEKRVA